VLIFGAGGEGGQYSHLCRVNLVSPLTVCLQQLSVPFSAGE